MVLRGFDRKSRGTWVLLALTLAVAWSMSGLIFRQIQDASAAEIIFYRGISLSTAVSLFVVRRYRSRCVAAWRGLGPVGLYAAFSLGSASCFYLFALKATTIANIAFLNAATPFVAGVLAWVLLRERMSRLTLSAIGLAMIGVAIMVWEGFAVGSPFGNLMALCAVLVSGSFAVSIRYARGIDLIPAVALSGYIAALLVSPLVDSFAISLHDLAFCMLQGVFISGLCNGLYTLCARRIPAAELTLLSLFEFGVVADLGLSGAGRGAEQAHHHRRCRGVVGGRDPGVLAPGAAARAPAPPPGLRVRPAASRSRRSPAAGRAPCRRYSRAPPPRAWPGPAPAPRSPWATRGRRDPRR